MRSFFNYDNKFMTTLALLGDFVLLNILYVTCCVPLFTIGAAQAGMFTAMRVLMDPDDDSSLLKAYFRGFANGFSTISVVSGILILLLGVAGFSGVVILSVGGPQIIQWVALLGLLISCIFQPVPGLFHSRFRCNVFQLLRNSCLFFMTQSFRIFAMAVLVWAPLILLLLNVQWFSTVFPVFIVIYYSVAYWLSYLLMKKPLRKLEEMHLQRSQETETEETSV